MFGRSDRDRDEDVKQIEGDAAEDMGADLESQAADYFAGNDVWLYGANAPAVLAILDRLEGVGVDEGAAIAEAWRAAPKGDRDAARKAARKLTEADEELDRHVQMARQEIGAWLAVAAEYPDFVKAAPDWGKTAAQVGEAALDATTALILDQDLSEEQYQSLSQPWTEATEAFEVEAELEEIEGELDEEEEEGDEEGEFGPNSIAVTDFLNRLWLITPEQVARLVSAWQDTPKEDLEAAHEALHDIVEEDEAWRDQVKLAQEQIASWLNGGRIEETSGFLGQTGQGVTRRMAGPALADALAALVVGDLLEPGDAQTLYAPWFNLVGAPPLPESGPEDGEADEGSQS
jgi:hypothetical protein